MQIVSYLNNYNNGVLLNYIQSDLAETSGSIWISILIIAPTDCTFLIMISLLTRVSNHFPYYLLCYILCQTLKYFLYVSHLLDWMILTKISRMVKERQQNFNLNLHLIPRISFSENYDPCCSFPCQNRGVCSPTKDYTSYTCDCGTLPYYGKNCEKGVFIT